jgi:23S rRNA (adenine2503-C2)-methyltransferase
MSACAAFGLTPTELALLPPGGTGNAAFAALQRPWCWDSTGPRVEARAQRALPAGSFTPPTYEASRSTDGSTKLLFAFGNDRVETVHMPRGERVTLCLSSQVGCALGCRFCATASMGFGRHLSAGEMVAQVLTAIRGFGPRHPSQVTLVFMGMGEPLHNWENVQRAIEILGDPRGMGLCPRRITVSTSGLVPQIDLLAKAPIRPLLALSLNATTDALRRDLMPIGQRYSLDDLAAALTRFPLRTRERILVEYVLLAGVNDTDADAQRLAEFGHGFAHHLNLIPFNEHPGSAFRAPSDERVSAFAKAVLARRPRLLTVRRSRARDVQGACGQLVVLHRSKTAARAPELL